MSSKWRRFEILLPQQYNDGREIPRRFRGRALKEVIREYGAVSFEPRGIEGHWIHQGIHYTDSLSKIVVDLPETDENRMWMRDFKERWRLELEQIEIWLISFEIEVE